jgi:hypothetical protein
VSYAIAISIDVTIYLLSWTAFQRYRKYQTPKAVWQHWLLIVVCTVFSWVVNWAYAKQFHSPVMLNSAEGAAPWLTNVFPFMASAFPLLGIVYTMMAETITETAAEEKKEQSQMSVLADLAKTTQLPMSTLRRALASGNGRLNPATLLGAVGRRPTADVSAETAPATPSSTELTTDTDEQAKIDVNRPITGQFVALDDSALNNARNGKAPVTANGDGSTDKLQMTIETLRARPDITDDALAEILALKRPASARFWRLKAIEILNASTDENARQTGSLAQAPLPDWSRDSTDALAQAPLSDWSRDPSDTLINGSGAKH